MKLPSVVCLVALLLIATLSLNNASSQDTAPRHTAYEYASVRFDGASTCIVWQDGTIDKVTAVVGKKTYEPADMRIWYLTVAMNIMAKKGFVALIIDNSEVIMMRSSAKPKREYAATRFTGTDTSVVWPDGNVDKVLALSGKKNHNPADIRMWHITGAMNLMGAKGFIPFRSSRDTFWRADMVDVWMEKILAE
jgi:hypothetical protein